MVAAKRKPTETEESDIFAPCSFSSLGLHTTLCEQLEERLGFKAPTLVQAQAIPVVLSGSHVLVNAATGTGKTVAYLAPVIHHLHLYQPRIQSSNGTFALVLVPTRELCLQVHEILHKVLHKFHWIVPGYVMGGENRSKEKARLQKGISILVATPGRLLDHLKNTSSFVHTNLRWIIFDEADRILELGFGKEIEEILDFLGSRQHGSATKNGAVATKFEFPRQNLLLSATLNEKVNHLAKMSLEKPVMIGMPEKKRQSIALHEHLGSDTDDDDIQTVKATGSVSEDYRLPAQLTQKYVKVPCNARLAVLLSILKYLFEQETSEKIVLFFSTCDAVDFHYSLLSEFQFKPSSGPGAELKQRFVNYKTFRLHGNMEQEDRRSAFETFKREKSALLLSTDVCARGLDFPKVKRIIQYDSPGEATEYVHRVGRTARLGERGDSLLFLQPIEMDYLKELEKYGVSLAEFPLLKILDSFPLYGYALRCCVCAVKKALHLEKDLYERDHRHCGFQFEKNNDMCKIFNAWHCISGLGRYVAVNLFNPDMKTLAKNAFCSWVRAYTAHRSELKRIFMVKKLHLGHVAKSFALKDQPSLVLKSFHNQEKKRKRGDKQKGLSRKRKVSRKT